MSTESSSEQPAKSRDNDGLHKRRGIWYYCLEVAGKRRFFSTKTRSYAEARKKRAAAITLQQQNRLPTDLAKWPFEKLLEQVKEDRKPHLAENSIRIEQERSGPLLKAFRGRRVCEIDVVAIRDYQKKRVRSVSAKTVNLETELLRHVLKAAKVWAHVADDFKPLPKNSPGPGRALEPEEEKLLFETAREKPQWDAAFYAALVASNTTMRGHELKRLRLESVDLLERQLVIRKSKTKAGQRVIPLNSAAVWAFVRLLDRAHALGCKKPEHFLFPAFRYRKTKTSNHGTGYDPTNPQKTWRTAWRSLVKETARRAGRRAAQDAFNSGKGIPEAIAAWRRARGALKEAAIP